MNTDLGSSIPIVSRYGATSPARYRGVLKTIRSLRFVLCLSSLLASVTTLAAQEIISGTFGANLNYSVGIASEREIGEDEVEWSPTGPRFAFIFGISPELDLEVSGAWLSSGGISSLDLIVGGHYNIDTGTPLTPYIGIGGGVSWIYYNNAEVLTIAFQGTAGIVYDIWDWLSLVLGYRLTGTTEAEMASGETLKTAVGHNIDLGLLLPF